MSSQGPPAPRSVGAYEVLGLVAASATGSVWRGRDHALGRDVALKQVAGAAVRSVEQLRTEARLLARLSHPNIVGVIDLIETPGEWWLVEEWVDGATLANVTRLAGRFSPVQAVGVVRGGLLGLDYAHSHQVVHGDVSPSNLLLDLGGVAKLIDFGLARPAGATGVTGTPGYLSPEAAWGLPLVPASDVYSAAAVLMLLLRGRPLFEGTTPEAVLAAQFGPGIPDLSDVGAPMRAVLHAALAPSAAHRPVDARHFLALLDEAADRTFGRGWLAGAGVAGLVSAAVTAGAATAAGVMPAGAGAALVQGAPTGPNPPLVSHVTRAVSTPPGADHSTVRRVRRLSRSRRLLVGAGTGVAVVTTAAILVAQHSASPARPLAATRAPLTTSPAARSTDLARPVSFDLHSVDWDNITVPGRACFASHAITLHNGKATLPIPPASRPGLPPGGYLLTRSIAPQYGPLANGGPMVAVLGLMCAGTGSNSGTGTFWPSVVVFDAPAGRVQVLGLYSVGDLGTVAGTGSGLVPRQLRVQGGVITVAGVYLRGQDAHCCPSGRGTTTIAYRDGRLAPSRVISTALGSGGPAPTSPSSPAPAGVGRTIVATGPSGQTYVATVRAEDTVSDCAANSYGAAVIKFFEQHPCPSGAGRRLVTIPVKGRTVALSMIVAGEHVGPPGDLYKYASELSKLERAPGTGGLDDLLRSGVRPAGWPAAIPANEAFLVTGEDATVEIFDAWYLDGSTRSQDPELLRLAEDLFLTPITTGPF